jgi:two-component system, cell cycle sensor histidine kinase and response regulator CckA
MTSTKPPARLEAGTRPELVIDAALGQIIDANDAAESFYGYARDELRGMPLSCIALDAGERAFGILGTPPRGTTFPSRHRLATGEERSVMVDLSFGIEGGRMIGHARMGPWTGPVPQSTPVDPDAARRYRDLVEHLGAGLALFSPGGDLQWINATMAEILGGDASTVLHRYRDLLSDEAVDTWCRACSEELPATGAIQLDLPVTGLDGSPLMLEIHARVLPDGSIEGVIHDVTEARASAAALAASEELNRTLVDDAFDGIVLIGPDRHVRQVNPTACEILGVRPGDVETVLELQRNSVPLASPEGRAERLARFRAGETVTGEATVRRPDGRVIIVEQRARRRADGSTVASIRDVTAARKAQVALEHREAKVRELVESAEDLVLLTSTDGRITYGNRALARLTGVPLDRLIGMHGIELLDPRDRQAAHAAAPAVLRGEVATFEARIRRPDGSGLWVEARVHRLPSGDTETIARDISRRKALEAERTRLLQALDQATDAVVLTDLAGTASYVNPAFVRMSGMAPDRLLGHPASEWFRGDATGGQGFDRVAERVTADGAWSGDLRARRPDGSNVTVAVRIALVRDSDGEAVGFLGLATDVTWERAQTERMGEASRVESMAQLSAAIAHDFNNLLTGVLGYAQLAQSAPPGDPALAENLSQIVDAAQRAERLTRRLMDFGRQSHVEPEDVATVEAVRALLPTLRRIAGDRVDVVLEAGDDTSRIRVDPGLLEIALVAVVENAGDAMPEGGTVRITVGGPDPAETPPAGRWAVIRVRDDGPGIPADVLARLSDPLPALRPEGGVTLGLPMVSGFLLRSRGHLRITSGTGAGTTIALYLPLADHAGEAAPAQPGRITRRGDAATGEARSGSRRPAIPPGTPAGGRPVVLVVDDEPVLRTIAERVLSMAGYDVLIAASGEEALAVAADPHVRVDLLFTDIVMPGIHGPALAATLVAARPGLRVLITSGFAPDEADRAGLGIGGAPFLPKPYTPGDLTAAVARVLGAVLA